jgi:hypothetical protein
MNELGVQINVGSSDYFCRYSQINRIHDEWETNFVSNDISEKESVERSLHEMKYRKI